MEEKRRNELHKAVEMFARIYYYTWTNRVLALPTYMHVLVPCRCTHRGVDRRLMIGCSDARGLLRGDGPELWAFLPAESHVLRPAETEIWINRGGFVLRPGDQPHSEDLLHLEDRFWMRTWHSLSARCHNNAFEQGQGRRA